MNNTSVHAKPITRSVPPNLVELEAGGLALGTEVGRRWGFGLSARCNY